MLGGPSMTDRLLDVSWIVFMIKKKIDVYWNLSA